MRVLVTGGAGLIGSHLVDHLLGWGHTVFMIDNLSTGDIENVNEKLGNNFYKIDLRRRDWVNFVTRIARPEVVFHLAAWAHEGLSQYAPSLIIENNISASMNLLAACIKAGNLRRFIFTSSMSVYGDQPAPFNEAMERKPVDIYGVSKASFENMLEIMAEVYGLEYTIFRPHNVIGPRQALHDPYRNVVGIFMNRIMKGEPVYVYGDGEQKRAFSFVNDFVPILAESMVKDAAKNETFNIGADHPYSINELIVVLRSVIRKDFKVVNVPSRQQEVNNAWCSNEKAKHILGFEDKTVLYEGLFKMWEWAQKKGPQEPRYLNHLELTNKDTPAIWTEKKI